MFGAAQKVARKMTRGIRSDADDREAVMQGQDDRAIVAVRGLARRSSIRRYQKCGTPLPWLERFDVLNFDVSSERALLQDVADGVDEIRLRRRDHHDRVAQPQGLGEPADALDRPGDENGDGGDLGVDGRALGARLLRRIVDKRFDRIASDVVVRKMRMT